MPIMGARKKAAPSKIRKGRFRASFFDSDAFVRLEATGYFLVRGGLPFDRKLPVKLSSLDFAAHWNATGLPE